MAAQPSYSHITKQKPSSPDPTRTTESNATSRACNNLDLATSTPPELCPPHWRLCNTNNHSLRIAKTRAIAKKVLLKQFTIPTKPTSGQPTPKMATPIRANMRMKDSDDYITARAANPRTGLISPSLAGTPSPRTPESPAEALKLRPRRNFSPPYCENQRENQARPALTRANEARKISAGNLHKLRTNGNGWSFEDARFGFASPRASDATAGAADIAFSTLNPEAPPIDPSTGAHRDDQFVVHMPSAREPQPYAYPGRSAEEIQAFEHYKSKARKTSGEGWDQRRLPSGGIRKSSAEIGGRHNVTRRVSAGEHEKQHRKKANGGPLPIHISKRRDGTVVRHGGIANLEVIDGIALPVGGDVYPTAASFAPYSSPKTPARRTSGRHKANAPITHLSQLPKLHFVHPELASLPLPKLRRQCNQTSSRACSLGCESSPNSGTCPQLTHSPQHPHPLFPRNDEDRDGLQFPLDHATALLSYLLAALRAAHEHFSGMVYIRIPTPAMVATLTSPDASVGEKLSASKELLTLAGQVVGVLVAVSVVWKVLDAVAGVLCLVVWPLAVPLRLVWWVFVG